jgi:hypothetical protein
VQNTQTNANDAIVGVCASAKAAVQDLVGELLGAIYAASHHLVAQNILSGYVCSAKF